MTRRIVLATVAAAISAAAAVPALASSAPVAANTGASGGSQGQVCVILVKSPDGSHTQDFCVTYPNP